MTRWARVGNSQKHKQLPEDATPWENFWQNGNQNSTDDANRNKVKSGRIEKKKQKKKFGIDGKRKVFDKPKNLVSKLINAEQEENESNQTSPKFSSEKEIDEEHLNTEFRVLSKKLLRKEKKKAKLQLLKNTESNDMEDDHTSNVGSMKENESNHTSSKFSSEKEIDEEHLSTELQVLSKKQLRKEKKKAKLQQLKNTESNDVQDDDTSDVADSLEVSKTEDKSSNKKDFQGKKKLFMEKLEKKRKENGILLLPAKTERRLYIIKKRLREKGLPAEAIKDIARKERRKEELKFRGSVSTKTCFNCRQVGHIFADCPMKLGKAKQETGLCFKCGSAEHTSFKCPEKIEGYPLAKCFVCKEQGHISRDCPKNEHGIYIKGGKCRICGNFNHLKKDCPTLKKKNDEEADITAYTINDEKSIDAEIIPTEDVKLNVKTSVKKGKKAKLVKF